MGKAFRMAAGILGWAALALQYALVLTGTLGADSFTRSVNFFSYFTILTNILAALALTLPWLAPQSALGKFFARPSVRTAIAAYIIIVMTIVYFVLRHLTDLQGWDFVADLLLHYVMPVLFVIDWLFLVPKQTLKMNGHDFLARLSGHLSRLDFHPRRLFRLLSLSLFEWRGIRQRARAAE